MRNRSLQLLNRLRRSCRQASVCSVALRTLFALAVHAPVAANEATTFVCNETLATDCLSPTDFTNIISGYKQRMDQGGVIRVVIVKGDPSYQEALLHHVNKTNAQFLNHWRRLVFTGRGIMPAVFDSREKALEYLAATPYAIGLFHYEQPLPPRVQTLSLCAADS